MLIMLRTVIFVLAAVALGGAAAFADYKVARDTPEWFKESFLEFADDVAEAADEGKRVMIYFGQDDCPYCQHLHDINWRQTDILQKMQTHLDSIAVNMFGDAEVVWVDGESYTEKTLSQKLGIQFTPTLLFLDENAREVLRIQGYQPPRKYSAALDYVIDKKEGESFADYLRAHTADNAPTDLLVPDEFASAPYRLSSPGAPTAVLVVQKNCPYCAEWQAFLLSDKAAPWRDHFDFVQLDMFSSRGSIDGGVSESEWTTQQQISFVPALIFLDAAGNEEFRADGYIRSFHLASVLDYVASAAYKTEPEFQRFLQARSERIQQSGGEVTVW